MLVNTHPLQTYIDAKDEFDYKHNNYTTTEFLDTTPNEDVRQQQQKLNELGYTDKFGEKLKEDGIEGAKTRYAKDSYESATQKYRNSRDLTSRSGNRWSVNTSTPKDIDYQISTTLNSEVRSKSNQKDNYNNNTKLENVRLKDAVIKPKGYLSEKVV